MLLLILVTLFGFCHYLGLLAKFTSKMSHKDHFYHLLNNIVVRPEKPLPWLFKTT